MEVGVHGEDQIADNQVERGALMLVVGNPIRRAVENFSVIEKTLQLSGRLVQFERGSDPIAEALDRVSREDDRQVSRIEFAKVWPNTR